MSFDIKQKLTGAQLAGGNPSAGHRTENDFYATDPQAVNALFNALSKYDPAANMELKTGDYVTCRCDNGVNYIVTKP